jgi:hypothetical protein
VKHYPYSERDYTFGQLMLTLRTTIGLTQTGWVSGWAFPGAPWRSGRPASATPKRNASHS